MVFLGTCDHWQYSLRLFAIGTPSSQTIVE
jgi:hypothetical protein